VYLEKVARGLHEKGKKKEVEMVVEQIGNYPGEQGKLF
jgi:hypothetical protein